MEQRADFQQQWLSPATHSRVHVEIFSTVAEAGWSLQALQWLGPAERAYGATFARSEDRERFLASRYRLRTTLENFTGVAAGRWHFRRNDEGRWTVLTDPDLPSVSFSVAHSGKAVAVAVGDGVELGIDLEPRRDYPLDADAAWTANERSALRRLPPALRTLAELRLWTAKEAYLKLLGRGAFADFASTDLSALVSGTEFGKLPAQFRFGSTELSGTHYDVCVAFRGHDLNPLHLELPTWLEEQLWNRTR